MIKGHNLTIGGAQLLLETDRVHIVMMSMESATTAQAHSASAIVMEATVCHV